MKGMASIQQKQLEKTAIANPSASIEEIVEAGRKQPKIKQIIVVINDQTDDALTSFAQEQGTDKNDAASQLIASGLTDRGYMAASDERA